MKREAEGVCCLLPMSRIFPDSPNAKILDCFMSNYQIGQSLDHVSEFTGLDKDAVSKGIKLLADGKLIKRTGNRYVTNFKSERLVGLFSYYRATLGSNLSNALAAEQ